MESIGYLLVLAIVAAAISGFASTKKRNRGKGAKASGGPSPAIFRAKRVLSDPEQVLFSRLKAALPDHVILSQVAFSQFLYAKGGDRKQNFSRFAEARQKVADFLVCNPSFQIMSVVELDDRSHQKEKDEKRDAILNEACLKVVRWKASNIPNTETIRRQLLETCLMNEREQTDDAVSEMKYKAPLQK